MRTGLLHCTHFHPPFAKWDRATVARGRVLSSRPRCCCRCLPEDDHLGALLLAVGVRRVHRPAVPGLLEAEGLALGGWYCRDPIGQHLAVHVLVRDQRDVWKRCNKAVRSASVAVLGYVPPLLTSIMPTRIMVYNVKRHVYTYMIVRHRGGFAMDKKIRRGHFIGSVGR